MSVVRRKTAVSANELLTTADYWSAVASFLSVRFVFAVCTRLSRFHYRFLCGDKSNAGWLRALVKTQVRDAAVVLVSENNEHRQENFDALLRMADTLFDALDTRHFGTLRRVAKGLEPYRFSFPRLLGCFYFPEFEQIADETKESDSAEDTEKDKALLKQLSMQKVALLKTLPGDDCSMESMIEIACNPPPFTRTKPKEVGWIESVNERLPSDKFQLETKIIPLKTIANLMRAIIVGMDQIEKFVSVGGLEAFRYSLCHSTDARGVNMSLAGLCLIAASSAKLRDYVLDSEILPEILPLLSHATFQSPVLRVLRGLCEDNSLRTWKHLESFLPRIVSLAESSQLEIAAESLSTISSMSNFKDIDIEKENALSSELLRSGVLPVVAQRVNEALTAYRTADLSPETRTQMDALLEPCVRIIGHIVCTEEHVDAVLEHFDFYALIGECLEHSVDTIRTNALWTLSNALAGTQSQKEPFFRDESLIRKVISLTMDGDVNERIEGGWVLCNALSSSTFPQITTLVDVGLFRAMHSFMQLPSHCGTMQVGIEAVDNILEAAAGHYELALWKTNCKEVGIVQLLQDCDLDEAKWLLAVLVDDSGLTTAVPKTTTKKSSTCEII